MAVFGTRPIPWRSLVTWAIAVLVLTNALVLVVDRDGWGPSVLSSSIVAATAYLLLGALLASRTGWGPPSAKTRAARPPTDRADGESRPSRSGRSADAPKAARPAPTSRTNLTNRRTPPKRR